MNRGIQGVRARSPHAAERSSERAEPDPMPICSGCGAEHELLEPAFGRPDAYLSLSERDRAAHAKADDDFCRIALPDLPPHFSVRAVLPVEVAEYSAGTAWGIWARVSEATFNRVVELCSVPDQSSHPPFFGRIANAVPGYANTLDLPVSLHLAGPRTRPKLSFSRDIDHEFANECRFGISMHRAAEWSSLVLEWDASARQADDPDVE